MVGYVENDFQRAVGFFEKPQIIGIRTEWYSAAYVLIYVRFHTATHVLCTKYIASHSSQYLMMHSFKETVLHLDMLYSFLVFSQCVSFCTGDYCHVVFMFIHSYRSLQHSW